MPPSNTPPGINKSSPVDFFFAILENANFIFTVFFPEAYFSPVSQTLPIFTILRLCQPLRIIIMSATKNIKTTAEGCLRK